jgi:hypothetical protein
LFYYRPLSLVFQGFFWGAGLPPCPPGLQKLPKFAKKVKKNQKK